LRYASGLNQNFPFAVVFADFPDASANSCCLVDGFFAISSKSVFIDKINLYLAMKAAKVKRQQI
jgi:hypothetical protein